MDVQKCRRKPPTDCFVVVKKSDEMEKLRRKREINARYSRLLLSKTIKQFQKQGHVTICLSEKLNGNVDDENLKMKKLTTNLQLYEPKNRTISFWQFPATLNCEFQMETKGSRAMKSVRTQTNFTNHKQKEKTPRFNRNKTGNTSNEIVSSHVSGDGNVMSLVMRSKHKKRSEDKPMRSYRKPAEPRTPRTPLRKYRSERNVNRSKNFWASYNNFILCNRSIELRITKLFSIPNTQYIVAFSKDFFEQSKTVRAVPSEREISYESCCAIQFMKFDINACICELFFVEHIIDFGVSINCNERRQMNTDIPILLDGDDDDSSNENASNIKIELNEVSNGHCYLKSSSNRQNNFAMMSLLVLSFCVVFVYVRNWEIKIFFEK